LRQGAKVKKNGSNKSRRALALVGPTASGKTGVALEVALGLGTEIINVDSRQIYRRLDIPTAAETGRVPHHLFDFVDPGEVFNVGAYRREAERTVAGFEERGLVPFFVGGTGLYLKAVLEGLCPAPEGSTELRRWIARAADFPAGGLHALLERIDPDAADRIHPHDTQRLTRALEVYYLTGQTLSYRQASHNFSHRPFETVIVALRRDAEDLKARIAARLEEMMQLGFREEVAALLDDGLDPALPSMNAVGYRQMAAHISGEAGLDETLEEIRRATWQYARRQMTWFRGVDGIRWLDASPSDNAEELAEKALALFAPGVAVL
jgi:tRNA dimethylallyltransferase